MKVIETERLLLKSNSGWDFMIFRKSAPQKLVGIINLVADNLSGHIAIVINPEYRDKKLGQEATAAIIELAKQRGLIPTLEINNDEEHGASRHIAGKFGFKRIGQNAHYPTHEDYQIKDDANEPTPRT